MGAQVTSLNKAWLNNLADRGPAQVLRIQARTDPGMTVQSTCSAVHVQQSCAVMMINSVHRCFPTNKSWAK